MVTMEKRHGAEWELFRPMVAALRKIVKRNVAAEASRPTMMKSESL